MRIKLGINLYSFLGKKIEGDPIAVCNALEEVRGDVSMDMCDHHGSHHFHGICLWR
jgi:hypothetical protein